ATGREDVAAIALDSRAQELVVASDGAIRGLGLMLPAGGAALDVGEEEGDSAARQPRHGRPPHCRCGSKASRSPSVNSRMQSLVKEMARPGAATSHQPRRT